MAYGVTSLSLSRYDTQQISDALSQQAKNGQGFAEGALYIREVSGEDQVWVWTSRAGHKRIGLEERNYKFTYKPDSPLAISDWADDSKQSETIGLDLSYVAGDRIEISYDQDNYWLAEVDSYDSETGSITFSITEGIAAGTDSFSIFTFDVYNPSVRNDNVLSVKIIVASYTALTNQSNFTPANGDFGLVTAPQGTKYLPGSLGGDFYPAGLYVYNSTDGAWEFLTASLSEGVYTAVQNQPPLQTLTSTQVTVSDGSGVYDVTNTILYYNKSGDDITGVDTDTTFDTTLWQVVDISGTGTNVVANPGGTGDDLTTIALDGVVYDNNYAPTSSTPGHIYIGSNTDLSLGSDGLLGLGTNVALYDGTADFTSLSTSEDFEIKTEAGGTFRKVQFVNAGNDSSYIDETTHRREGAYNGSSGTTLLVDNVVDNLATSGTFQSISRHLTRGGDGIATTTAGQISIQSANATNGSGSGTADGRILFEVAQSGTSGVDVMGLTADGVDLSVPLLVSSQAAPTGVAGSIYFDSTSNTFKGYQNSTDGYVDIIGSGGGGSFNGILSDTPLILRDTDATPDGESDEIVNFQSLNNADAPVQTSFAKVGQFVRDNTADAEEGGIVIKSTFAGTVEDIFCVNTSDKTLDQQSGSIDPKGVFDVRTTQDDLHILLSDKGLFIEQNADNKIGFYEDGASLVAPRQSTFLRAGNLSLENFKEVSDDDYRLTSVESGFLGNPNTNEDLIVFRGRLGTTLDADGYLNGSVTSEMIMQKLDDDGGVLFRVAEAYEGETTSADNRFYIKHDEVEALTDFTILTQSPELQVADSTLTAAAGDIGNVRFTAFNSGTDTSLDSFAVIQGIATTRSEGGEGGAIAIEVADSGNSGTVTEVARFAEALLSVQTDVSITNALDPRITFTSTETVANNNTIMVIDAKADDDSATEVTWSNISTLATDTSSTNKESSVTMSHYAGNTLSTSLRLAADTTLLGHGANVTADTATAIGAGALADTANTVVLGTTAETVILPGEVTMSGVADATAGVVGISATGVLSRVAAGGDSTIPAAPDALAAATVYQLQVPATGSLDPVTWVIPSAAGGSAFTTNISATLTDPTLTLDSDEGYVAGNETGRINFDGRNTADDATVTYASIFVDNTSLITIGDTTNTTMIPGLSQFKGNTEHIDDLTETDDTEYNASSIGFVSADGDGDPYTGASIHEYIVNRGADETEMHFFAGDGSAPDELLLNLGQTRAHFGDLDSEIQDRSGDLDANIRTAYPLNTWSFQTNDFYRYKPSTELGAIQDTFLNDRTASDKIPLYISLTQGRWNLKDDSSDATNVTDLVEVRHEYNQDTDDRWGSHIITTWIGDRDSATVTQYDTLKVTPGEVTIFGDDNADTNGDIIFIAKAAGTYLYTFAEVTGSGAYRTSDTSANATAAYQGVTGGTTDTVARTYRRMEYNGEVLYRVEGDSTDTWQAQIWRYTGTLTNVGDDQNTDINDNHQVMTPDKHYTI